MKVVVSRRVLAKLCYKVASLLDIMELSADVTTLSINENRLVLSCFANVNPRNPVVFNGKLSGYSFDVDIPVEKVIVDTESKIDFGELCQVVSNLSKEIMFVELVIRKGHISVLRFDNK